MDPSPLDSTMAPPPRSPMGFAIASLVFGILALVLSFLLVGGLMGLIGLIFGVAHLAKKRSPLSMAAAGIILSVLGVIVAIGFAALYYTGYQQFAKMVQSQSNDNGTLNQWQGVIAPDFAVRTLDNQTIKLSDFKGKRVVLDFWATWCSPSHQEIPHFIKLFGQTSRDDVVIMGISDEDPAKLRSFVAKYGINYPVASATNLPSPYNDLQYIPTTFFIDRKGIIETIAVGYHDYDQIKGDALAPDTTAPPGSAPGAASTPLPDSGH